MTMKDDRLLYAAVELLDYAGGTLNRYQLNKALFYLDLYHYGETGETFTGATYVAETNGPVVQNYKDALVTPLVTSKVAMEPPHDERNDGAWKSLMLLVKNDGQAPPDLERFGRRAVNLLRDSRIDLESYVHSNLGWSAAIQAGRGTPINMMLAYTQVAPRDPWLDELVTEAEQARLAYDVHDAIDWS